MFTGWLLGSTCGRAARETAQARVCGDGDSAWDLLVLAVVVGSIFVPALLLVRLWRRIGLWALLPVAVVTVAVPVLATYALDLAPG